MKILICFSVLLIASSGAVSAMPRCPPVVLNASIGNQHGPTCLVASAASSLSTRGHRIDVKKVTRETAVFPDGIHPYDLAETLKTLGFEGLLFTGPPEAAARLVEAGFSPIMLLQAGASRHAVAITGSQRKMTAEGCSKTLSKLRVSDSKRGQHRWVSADDLTKQQSGDQLLVFYRKADMAQLTRQGFPLNTAQGIDARYRAEVLYRRAVKHVAPNTQQANLLKGALKHDPCHVEASSLLQLHFPTVAQSYRNRCDSN